MERKLEGFLMGKRGHRMEAAPLAQDSVLRGWEGSPTRTGHIFGQPSCHRRSASASLPPSRQETELALLKPIKEPENGRFFV